MDNIRCCSFFFFFIWIASILVKWSARSEIRMFCFGKCVFWMQQPTKVSRVLNCCSNTNTTVYSFALFVQRRASYSFWALSSYSSGREGDSVGQGTGTAAGLRCAVRLCVWAGFWILGAGLTLKLNSSPQIKGTLWSWGETCVHTCVCLCATTVMVS